MRGARRRWSASRARQATSRVSLHCETAEIMAAYTRMVQGEGKLTGLHAYSAARPPHSEGLAIWIAVLSRPRDRLPEHQPAAPDLAQGGGSGAEDAAGVPAHELSARGDGRASVLDTDCDVRGRSPRSIRRSARARTSSACGRRCSTARSTGSSATTPAAGSEMKWSKERPERHLARQVRVRRHRVPAVRR